jgi:hypothetical protein
MVAERQQQVVPEREVGDERTVARRVADPRQHRLAADARERAQRLPQQPDRSGRERLQPHHGPEELARDLDRAAHHDAVPGGEREVQASDERLPVPVVQREGRDLEDGAHAM